MRERHKCKTMLQEVTVVKDSSFKDTSSVLTPNDFAIESISAGDVHSEFNGSVPPKIESNFHS